MGNGSGRSRRSVGGLAMFLRGRSIYGTATFALVVWFGSGCQGALASRPVVGVVTVDGEPREWSGVPMRRLDATSLTIGTQYDGSGLFVYLSTGDPHWLRLLTRTGATLFLDDGGDRDAAAGLRFWPTPTLVQPPVPDAGSVDQSASSARPLRTAVVGLTSPSRPAFTAYEGAIGGVWVAEFSLPFDELNRDPTGAIQLGLEIPVAPSHPARPGSAMGRGPGAKGGGRMGGGRMGGGRMGGGRMGGGQMGAGGPGRGAQGMTGGSGEGPGGLPAKRGRDGSGRELARRPQIETEVRWFHIQIVTEG